MAGCQVHWRLVVPPPLEAFPGWNYASGMSQDEAPVCTRHDEGVRMDLRTLHSDSSRPSELVGLFECPECGHERRLPLGTAA